MRRKTWFFKTGIPAALTAPALVFMLLVTACPTGNEDTATTTCTVSYSAGEGSGAAPANQTVAAGTSITLPNQGNMTAPGGKAFAGWKAGDQTYAAGDSFTVNADASFVAQWDKGGTLYEGFHNYPTGRVDPNG
ncbi:MAG: InlB B-repeat-containing protein, partial [Treponema sp.]|nr:InlB B-repeat-containing protein [Treponema sp.]